MLAGERMRVSVCTMGRLSENVVVGAKAEVAALFHSMDVEIMWEKCEAGPIGEEAEQQHWFTIRLRDGGPVVVSGSASLNTLGEAFLADDQTGYVADVYYRESQALASRKQVEPVAMLGCVIAHELGHLLLGPGHAPNGIMHAAWDSRDLEAIRFGSLKFTPAESARIRRVLQNPASRATAAS
jgi:hypothetical protein